MQWCSAGSKAPAKALSLAPAMHEWDVTRVIGRMSKWLKPCASPELVPPTLTKVMAQSTPHQPATLRPSSAHRGAFRGEATLPF